MDHLSAGASAAGAPATRIFVSGRKRWWRRWASSAATATASRRRSSTGRPRHRAQPSATAWRRRTPDARDLSPDTLSPAEHVAEIRPALEKLESTVDELEEKKRESEIALKVKTQALEENKETFLHGSRFHESLYVLAGERFHADRLRPTVARAATPAPTVPPEVPGEDGEEPPVLEPPAGGSDAASAAEDPDVGLSG
jgi:hypothetical protein